MDMTREETLAYLAAEHADTAGRIEDDPSAPEAEQAALWARLGQIERVAAFARHVH
jgi:hypothetical protein